MSNYKIGTSGYFFRDWANRVYPENLKPSEYLNFYERELGFNALEINYTYYRLPNKKSISNMSKKTSDNFEFVVKANKEMTHDLDIKNGYIAVKKDVFKDFLDALEPIKKEGKLGGILAQFPYSFKSDKASAEYIRNFKDMAGDIPLFIEFRNSGWVRKSVFDFLKKNKIGYCVVDEPKLKGLVPFVSAITSDDAYIRLHGRNKNWFGASMSERYNYNYSDDELFEIALKVKNIGEKSKKSFIFFNNCHMGFAAKNAIKMRELLVEND